MGCFPIWVDAVVGVLLPGALGVLYGRRLFGRGIRLSARADARQFPLLTGLMAVFIVGNLAGLVARQHPLIWWYAPLSVQYYDIAFGWLIDAALLSFLFSALAVLAYRQRQGARWVLVACMVGVLVVCEWTIRHSAFLTPPSIGPVRISADGVILQTGDATCAAAACANIATKYGIPKTEREMVELLGTTSDGTSAGQVAYGMERLGFRCRKLRVADAEVSRVHAPAVLFVAFGSSPLGHAVAYMGNQDGVAEIWNPQGGRQFLSQAALGAIWLGHAVEMTMPTQDGTE